MATGRPCRERATRRASPGGDCRGAALALALAVTAGPASAAQSCTYDAASRTVTATLESAYDWLRGGSGADRIDGGEGDDGDSLEGGPGNDVLRGRRDPTTSRAAPATTGSRVDAARAPR